MSSDKMKVKPNPPDKIGFSFDGYIHQTEPYAQTQRVLAPRTEQEVWDQFAAAALAATISAVTQADWSKTKDGQRVTEATIAEQAACFANAMMAERKKRKESNDD